jgi:hypothetical protein
MEYTEKQIEEIVLKSYFQGVFETVDTEDSMINLNRLNIVCNWNGHIRVFLYIHLEQFNKTIIDKIDSILNMFETPRDNCDNEVLFYAKKENTMCVAFSTTKASIQRIVDRSSKIENKEDE